MNTRYSTTSLHNHFHPQAFPNQQDSSQKTGGGRREADDKLSALINGATVGVACAKADGTFTYVNRRYSNMLGYEPAELVGRTMQELTHPDDLVHNLLLYNRLGQTGETFEIEKRYFCKDGSTIWVQNIVCPLRDEEGRICEMFAISVDITVRKQAQATANKTRVSAPVRKRNGTRSAVSFPDFSAFYDQFAPQLWGILIGARLPATQAADILVNTLSRGWLELPSYRLGPEQLLSWLLGLAYDEGVPEHYLKGLLSET